MAENDERASPSADYRTRVLLALSLLNHREPTAETCDLAVRALQGATVADLVHVDQGAWARVAGL